MVWKPGKWHWRNVLTQSPPLSDFTWTACIWVWLISYVQLWEETQYLCFSCNGDSNHTYSTRLLRELSKIGYYYLWILPTTLWGRQCGRLFAKLAAFTLVPLRPGFFPVRGGVLSPTLWVWVWLCETCFGQLNIAEAMMCRFWACRKGPCILSLSQNTASFTRTSPG